MAEKVRLQEARRGRICFLPEMQMVEIIKGPIHLNQKGRTGDQMVMYFLKPNDEFRTIYDVSDNEVFDDIGEDYVVFKVEKSQTFPGYEHPDYFTLNCKTNFRFSANATFNSFAKRIDIQSQRVMEENKILKAEMHKLKDTYRRSAMDEDRYDFVQALLQTLLEPVIKKLDDLNDKVGKK